MSLNRVFIEARYSDDPVALELLDHVLGVEQERQHARDAAVKLQEQLKDANGIIDRVEAARQALQNDVARLAEEAKRKDRALQRVVADAYQIDRMVQQGTVMAVPPHRKKIENYLLDILLAADPDAGPDVMKRYAALNGDHPTALLDAGDHLGIPYPIGGEFVDEPDFDAEAVAREAFAVKVGAVRNRPRSYPIKP